MSINVRIQAIIDQQYSANKKAFANAVGVGPTVIQNIVGTRQGKPSYDVIEKICANANVSPDWLLTGSGPMLKTASKDSSNKPEPVVSYDPNVGVPYYDVDFAAGFDLMFNDQTVNPTANIVVYGFEKAKTWCNVTGDSMYPKICHGDMIALRECTLDDVMFGEIYAVVLDNIRTVKILRKAKDPAMLRFIPINTEKYDEQEFKKSRIIRIFEVLGNISRFV